MEGGGGSFASEINPKSVESNMRAEPSQNPTQTHRLGVCVSVVDKVFQTILNI